MLALLTAAMTASAPLAPAVDLGPVARAVLGGGCEKRLLGSPNHPFVEAQIACDGYLSFALVDQMLAGNAPAGARQLLHELLADALGRARAPFISGGTARVGGVELPVSVLYRGYLLLMLAGLEKSGAADERSTALFDALAARMAADFEAQPLWPSFGKAIWPCDNALAASGLVLHGRLRGSERSAKAGEALAARLEALARRKAGFPTRVDGAGKVLEPIPRGTVLAWTASFLAMSGHASSRRFTKLLLDGFCDEVPLAGPGVAACREWPRGNSHGPDAVSGPIVAGYGVGASALAIAATAASPEHATWHAGLLRLSEIGGAAALTSQPEERPLENALLAWAKGLRSW